MMSVFVFWIYEFRLMADLKMRFLIIIEYQVIALERTLHILFYATVNVITRIKLLRWRMKRQRLIPNVKAQVPSIAPDHHSTPPLPEPPQLPPPTVAQKLADVMAAKVGSWGFLIGQTIVLTTWVGCNLTPGLPHWDQSPFILLNLLFSFASAYTAPVVLMSQNRQSDEDRQQAMVNHQVNVQTAENLQRLHEKIDEIYAQKLAELTELIQQPQSPHPLQTAQTQPGASLQLSISHDIDPHDVDPHHIGPHYIGVLPRSFTQSSESLLKQSQVSDDRDRT